ncbi:MAG: hypothetical protein JNL60_12750 [Bacteroidia bacterium]|nr:hypothetical protein [Bacteroidia bacterium]
MKNKIAVISLTIVLSACGAVKLATPSDADAQRGSQKYPGLSLASLNEGKALFEQNCARCHGLKDPTKRDEEKWNAVVPRMVKKVNKKVGHEEIDPKEQQLILQYLVTMSTVKPAK